MHLDGGEANRIEHLKRAQHNGPAELQLRGGGALVFEGGYQPRKKNHVIRVVFQDQAMYACTSFRGAKMWKIGKKGVVLVNIDKFWKGHDGQIKKNACKNAYLGSIFIPEKYIFRVCFENPFTRMISSLKYKWPPGTLTQKPLNYEASALFCYESILL